MGEFYCCSPDYTVQRDLTTSYVRIHPLGKYGREVFTIPVEQQHDIARSRTNQRNMSLCDWQACPLNPPIYASSKRQSSVDGQNKGLSGFNDSSTDFRFQHLPRAPTRSLKRLRFSTGIDKTLEHHEGHPSGSLISQSRWISRVGSTGQMRTSLLTRRH